MEGENPQLSLVGTVLDGKYEVQRLIGRGGMGSVYAARQLQLDRQVAVKVLKSDLVADNAAVARFTREARASARIEHPNAVRVYDFGAMEGGGAYIVMEYLEGVSLRAMMRRSRVLTLDTIVEVVWQAASAVAAAHALGVVHRDLKPENLIVQASGGALTVKVVDFGLAKMLSGDSTQLTRPAEMMGTPKYMAPEQFGEGPADERVDVYALGVILYELLAGRPPFDGTFGEVVGKHLYTEPPAFAALGVEVPEAIELVVRKALAKRPEERTASAAELARGLLRACGAGSAVATALLQTAGRTSPLELESETIGGARPPDAYRTELLSRDEEITRIRRGARAIDNAHETGAAAADGADAPTEIHHGAEAEERTLRVAPPHARAWRTAGAVLAAAILGAGGTLVWMSAGTPEAAAPAPELAEAPALARAESAAGDEVAAPEGGKGGEAARDLQPAGRDEAERPKAPSRRNEPGRVGEAPEFRNGSLVFVADARSAAVARGGVLEIMSPGGGAVERFPLTLDERGTRLVVPAGARSRPGGLTVDQLVPPGELFEYRVRGADGAVRGSAVVARPKEL